MSKEGTFKDPGILAPDNSEDGFITQGFYISVVLGFVKAFWGVYGILVLGVIEFYGLDINPYSIHDFADYNFSIQSNPWIDKIQSKSNPYICGSDPDLTQSISNPYVCGSDADLTQSICNPPFCALVFELKIFSSLQLMK